LLFDVNLSPRLPAHLVEQFTGSRHVRDVGLRGTTDQDIWKFAGAADFTIVTKDDDFEDLVCYAVRHQRQSGL
jgi:predicted nuclease of predicted toxin-antitoxin system